MRRGKAHEERHSDDRHSAGRPGPAGFGESHSIAYPCILGFHARPLTGLRQCQTRHAPIIDAPRLRVDPIDGIALERGVAAAGQ
jgi:hypothetical protein